MQPALYQDRGCKKAGAGNHQSGQWLCDYQWGGIYQQDIFHFERQAEREHKVFETKNCTGYQACKRAEYADEETVWG